MFILAGHSRFLALTHSKLTLFQIANKKKTGLQHTFNDKTRNTDQISPTLLFHLFH